MTEEMGFLTTDLLVPAASGLLMYVYFIVTDYLWNCLSGIKFFVSRLSMFVSNKLFEGLLFKKENLYLRA